MSDIVPSTSRPSSDEPHLIELKFTYGPDLAQHWERIARSTAREQNIPIRIEQKGDKVRAAFRNAGESAVVLGGMAEQWRDVAKREIASHLEFLRAYAKGKPGWEPEYLAERARKKCAENGVEVSDLNAYLTSIWAEPV